MAASNVNMKAKVIFYAFNQLEDDDIEAGLKNYLLSTNDDIEMLSSLIDAATERESIVKIEGYFENVVPLYSDLRFKKNFRMSRETFQKLVMVLQVNPAFSKKNCGGKPMIPCDKQVSFDTFDMLLCLITCVCVCLCVCVCVCVSQHYIVINCKEKERITSTVRGVDS